ncbi:MAG TPA: hypothetical protein VMV81_07710, partial [Phycisphaerae bacterium]|nr:hypothetical protein [Phycisphaerae bacterium]
MSEVFHRRSLSPAAKLSLFILAGSFAFSAYKAATAPITYDEAYTYLRFAGQSSSRILKDYHVPNNHIFHTLLVHYSTRVFGDSLFAIRLPALCGAAIFLTSIWRIGRFLPRPVGDLWAVCSALTPALIDFNSLARGYSLGYGFSFAA